MQNKTIRILSTRPVDETTLQQAVARGIRVDVISFIETIAMNEVSIKSRIDFYAGKKCIIIFTSMNAVDAVIKQLQGHQPEWLFFCMGNTTRQLTESYFGNNKIVATGANATQLADEIILWQKTNDYYLPAVFFCGDQRRDELPGKLQEKGILLEEITTYKTIDINHTIKDAYDGILFFSPSAVHSFFKTNKANKETIFFAIGETTASTIKDYSDNKIVISDTPSKDDLLKKAVSWLGS
jgi:uroporphyrinogen-III synthase